MWSSITVLPTLGRAFWPVWMALRKKVGTPFGPTCKNPARALIAADLSRLIQFYSASFELCGRTFGQWAIAVTLFLFSFSSCTYLCETGRLECCDSQTSFQKHRCCNPCDGDMSSFCTVQIR